MTASLFRLFPPTPPKELPIINAEEIKSILYLGIRGEVKLEAGEEAHGRYVRVIFLYSPRETDSDRGLSFRPSGGPPHGPDIRYQRRAIGGSAPHGRPGLPSRPFQRGRGVLRKSDHHASLERLRAVLAGQGPGPGRLRAGGGARVGQPCAGGRRRCAAARPAPGAPEQERPGPGAGPKRPFRGLCPAAWLRERRTPLSAADCGAAAVRWESSSSSPSARTRCFDTT